MAFNLGRQLNYFITCTTADGLNYIATSKDDYIIRRMYIDRKNHSQNGMHCFYELVKKFYQVDDSNGLFLDLGANIGTTGIYFLKKLAPNLKLLAFEPDAENFKMLRANLILNDLYEKATVENCGLGAEEGEQTMYINAVCPGGNGMFAVGSGLPTETITIIALDKYFAQKNLRAEDIKYIWIDTEGFEPQVLLGMQNLLRENPAPIFMEFNPQWWQKSGFYEKMMKLLMPLYSNYVWIPEMVTTGSINPYPLEKLWEYQNSTNSIGSMGDIFLIKKS